MKWTVLKIFTLAKIYAVYGNMPSFKPFYSTRSFSELAKAFTILVFLLLTPCDCYLMLVIYKTCPLLPVYPQSSSFSCMTGLHVLLLAECETMQLYLDANLCFQLSNVPHLQHVWYRMYCTRKEA